MANGNPFYVDPLGGYDPNQGLQRVVSAIQAKSAAEKQEEANQAMQSEISEAIASNNPGTVSQVMMKYPKMVAAMQSAIGFKDESTKQNFIQGTQQILSGGDPEKILADRIQFLTDSGADPSDSINALQLYRENPEAFMLDAEMDLAGIAPKRYEAWRKATGKEDKSNRGTANITDFNRYLELKKTDAEAAEQFGRIIGVDKEPDKEIRPTTAMQNFEKWQQMPAGKEKDAFAKVIGVSPKETQKTLQEKQDRVVAKKQEILAANTLMDEMDAFMANEDYMSSVGGLTGRKWGWLKTTGDVDAHEALTSILNKLTIENLNKMSGPKTDKDVEVIKSASAGIRPGMSEDAIREKMTQIQDALIRIQEIQTEGLPVSSIQESLEEPKMTVEEARQILESM